MDFKSNQKYFVVSLKFMVKWLIMYQSYKNKVFPGENNCYSGLLYE